uniref:Putative secreted protein n=1 Tax=Ixodes ricinus TaxID=34613 RepID=A0A6B0U487_IXORI
MTRTAALVCFVFAPPSLHFIFFFAPLSSLPRTPPPPLPRFPKIKHSRRRGKKTKNTMYIYPGVVVAARCCSSATFP